MSHLHYHNTVRINDNINELTQQTTRDLTKHYEIMEGNNQYVEAYGFAGESSGVGLVEKMVTPLVGNTNLAFLPAPDAVGLSTDPLAVGLVVDIDYYSDLSTLQSETIALTGGQIPLSNPFFRLHNIRLNPTSTSQGDYRVYIGRIADGIGPDGVPFNNIYGVLYVPSGISTQGVHYFPFGKMGYIESININGDMEGNDIFQIRLKASPAGSIVQYVFNYYAIPGSLNIFRPFVTFPGGSTMWYTAQRIRGNGTSNISIATTLYHV